MPLRATPAITQLYAPQFAQFGFALEPDGNVYVGAVENDLGRGDAWAMPLSDTCVVMEHNITPARDMLLAEATPEAYACVTQVNESTLDCMPRVGIAPVEVAGGCGTSAAGAGSAGADGARGAAGRGPWPNEGVFSFVQETCGVKDSPLKAGHTYSSHSVMFFSGFFDELERDYPHEFAGLFEDFATPWSPEASSVICTALRRLTYRKTSSAGAMLYARSTVNAMVAELAADRMAAEQARICAGTTQSRLLAEEACALIERLLDEGRAVGVDELAARLYVGRSKLCATFRSETGEGVAAYVRRRRVERAEELLADRRLTIAEATRRLGYPRASAFSQAFRAATGLSPTQWRDLQL